MLCACAINGSCLTEIQSCFYCTNSDDAATLSGHQIRFPTYSTKPFHTVPASQQFPPSRSQRMTHQSENSNLPLRDERVALVQVFPHQRYMSFRFSLGNQSEFIKQGSGYKLGSRRVYSHLFFAATCSRDPRCSSS